MKRTALGAALLTTIFTTHAGAETVQEWVSNVLADIKLADSASDICPGLYADEIAIGDAEDEIVSRIGGESEAHMNRLTEIETSEEVRAAAVEKARAYGDSESFCAAAAAGSVPYVTTRTPEQQEQDEDLIDPPS